MTNERVTIGAGLGLMLGAAMPWVNQATFLGSTSRSGLASILGELVIIAGGVIVWQRANRRRVFALAIAAAVCALLAFVIVLGAGPGYSVGLGLVLTLAAAGTGIYISRPIRARATESAEG